MYISFNSMPASSRVWIYVSNKMLSDEQQVIIDNELKEFTQQWKRHGEDLRASYQIRYHYFILLAVDEHYNDISGCSIDASVNLIKGFEKRFNICSK